MMSFIGKNGISINLSGGTYHAFPDHMEGFCLLNDAAIGTRVLQSEELVKRVLIIDCDLHQGNGTSAIFAGDSSVFTFSIHGEKIFPLKKEKSDRDTALEDETGLANYDLAENMYPERLVYGEI